MNEKAKEDGTYVCVSFTDETNMNLKKFAESINLDPINNFHATIVYSERTLPVDYGSNTFSGSAKITGLQYLGDPNGNYRAIVLNIDSNEILKLHEKYKSDYGYKHPHQDFKQHISLAYGVPEGIDLSKIKLPNFDININKENIKKLKTD